MLPFLFVATIFLQEQVLTEEKPALLLFYTSYCPHSRHVLDYLANIGKKIPLCNAGESQRCKKELLERGGLMQVPCLMINDQPLYGSEQIIAWLNTHQDLLDSS